MLQRRHGPRLAATARSRRAGHLKRDQLRTRQVQRLHEPPQGVAIRLRAAALELLDAFGAETGPIGQALLRQPGCQTVMPK